MGKRLLLGSRLIVDLSGEGRQKRGTLDLFLPFSGKYIGSSLIRLFIIKVGGGAAYLLKAVMEAAHVMRNGLSTCRS